MNALRVSKHFKNGVHVGFKKYLRGRNIHLITGTGRDEERIAENIVAQLLRRSEGLGGDAAPLTKAIIDECKIWGRKATEAAMTGSRSVTPSAEQKELNAEIPTTAKTDSPDQVTRLYAVMDLYKLDEKARANANECRVATAWSNCQNIEQSKGLLLDETGKEVTRGICDQEMKALNFEELQRWVRFFKSKPVLRGGAKISAFRASNILFTIRHFLRFAKRSGLWKGFEDWRELFRGSNPKKLMDRIQKQRQKKQKEINFTLAEAQILWNLCQSRMKAFFGLALWAGHTQNEIATIIHDEFTMIDGELFLTRTREKTGVEGSWWIPPEVAKHVLAVMATRDPIKNPAQLAFLCRGDLPLVKWFADRHPTDSVGQAWEKILKRAKDWEVRHISFKFARKTMAQQVRLARDESYATLFCAQEINSVQAQFYSSPDPKILLATVRDTIYPKWKDMFTRINWVELRDQQAALRHKRDSALTAA